MDAPQIHVHIFQSWIHSQFSLTIVTNKQTKQKHLCQANKHTKPWCPLSFNPEGGGCISSCWEELDFTIWLDDLKGKEEMWVFAMLTTSGRGEKKRLSWVMRIRHLSCSHPACLWQRSENRKGLFSSTACSIHSSTVCVLVPCIPMTPLNYHSRYSHEGRSHF